MSAEKRVEKLNEYRIELSKLRALIKVSGSVENPSKVKEIKRTIARMLTVENEERLGVNPK
ncbi:50S ribosomal protein L29 [Candidatus Bathyarchaeota archaeon]|nr:50S ribosomal protein L29 [Candidatus Bathyarchaeota archaeon]